MTVDDGVVALATEVAAECPCERGSPSRECKPHPLNRAWLLDAVLDDEQRTVYEFKRARALRTSA